MPEWAELPSQDWVDHTESDDAKVVRGVLAPLMLEALKPQGKTILDIGCGEGYFARVLREAGAARTGGLDIAPGLIDEARKRDPDGDYHVQDIALGHPFAPETFDEISAVMSLMYIMDIEAAYRNIHAMLRPGGRLVASITNPYYSEPVGAWGWALTDGLYRWFESPKTRGWRLIARQVEGVLKGRFDRVLYVRNYFEVRAAKKRLSQADVIHVHRPFSEYLNYAKKNGLELEVMFEPKVTPELLAKYPDEPVAKALNDVPVLLVLVFKKV